MADSDEDPLLLVAASPRPIKRRRVEASPSPEIVESSDVDEREGVASSPTGYWDYVVGRIKPIRSPSVSISITGASEKSPVNGRVVHTPPCQEPPQHTSTMPIVPATSPRDLTIDHLPCASGNNMATPIRRSTPLDWPDQTPGASSSKVIIQSAAENGYYASPLRSPPFEYEESQAPPWLSPDAQTPHPPTTFRSSRSPRPSSALFISPGDHMDESQLDDDIPLVPPRSPSPRRYISSAFRRASISSSNSSSPTKQNPQQRAQSNPPSSPAVIPPLSPPRRALRQRTAIQLNPYSREALLYKSTLLRAGAKEALVKDPKRVLGPSDKAAEPAEDSGPTEESQDREWAASQLPDEESQSPLRLRRSPSPRRGPRPSPPRRIRRPPSPVRRFSFPSPTPPRNSPPPPTHTLPPSRVPDVDFWASLGGLIPEEDEEGEEGTTRPMVKPKPIATYASKSNRRQHRPRTPPPMPSSSASPPPSRLVISSSSSTTAAHRSSLQPAPSTPIVIPSSSPPPDPSPFRTRSPFFASDTERSTDMPMVIDSDSDPPRPKGRLAARRRSSPSSGGGSDRSVQMDGSSDSDDPELTELQAKQDKQKKKALVRVLPMFMVKKLQAQAEQHERRAARWTSHSEEEEEEEQDQDQGRTASPEEDRWGRVRHVPNPGGRLDILGDPESSDPEPAPAAEPEQQPYPEDDNGSGSDGVVDFRRPIDDDRIAFSEDSGGEDGDSDNAAAGDDIHSWLERPTTSARRKASPLPRDGDLIDRMLSRHVDISATRKRKAPSNGNKKVTRRPRGQPSLEHFGVTSGRRKPSSSSRPAGHAPSRDKIHLDLTRAKGASATQAHPRHHRNGSTGSRRPAERSNGSASTQAHPRNGGGGGGGNTGSRSTNVRNAAVNVHWHERTQKAAGAEETIVISDEDDGPTDDGPREDDLFAVLRPKAPTTGNTVPQKLPQQRRDNVQKDRLVVDQRKYNSALSRKGARDSLIDFGLPVIAVASSFAPTTYLGSGRLIKLISVLTSEDRKPAPASVGHLTHGMATTDLEDQLPTLFDNIYKWGSSSSKQDEAVDVMQFLCEYVSWIGEPATNEEVRRILMLIAEQVGHLMGRQEETDVGENNDRLLWMTWFAVEMSLRLWRARSRAEANLPSTEALVPTSPAHRYMLSLMKRLTAAGFDAFEHATASAGSIVRADLQSAVAELWICCQHVVAVLEGSDTITSGRMGHPFWDRVFLSLTDDEGGHHVNGLEFSEPVWRSIITQTLLSRFTPRGVAMTNPRLPSCWPLVLQALSVRLEAEKDAELKTPAAVLQKRDAYIRLVLARCLLLVTRWKWNLCRADGVFNPLTTIFRSRKFENLRGEVSDFPVFLRDANEDAYLDPYDKRETSFGILLKLVLYAVRDYERDERGPTYGQKQIRKLASLILPIGSTPFTRDNPPLGRELSMLFNRFATVVIVIHMEPSNAILRVQQARRFLDFQKAECNSRSACIRGMMLIGVAHQRKQLDIGEVMTWVSEMATILLDDLQETEKPPERGAPPLPPGRKAELSILILQLVGALRKILETPSSDGLDRYPNPVFVEQACLDRIMQSSLSTDVRTNVEIRKLIQAFLNARGKALGPRSVPEEVPESESQDYGEFDGDMNDPVFLAFFGGGGPKTPEMLMEDRVANMMKSTLSPAIFRFIQRHFGDAGYQPSEGPRSMSDDDKDNVDRWVECWVGCVDVLVRNDIKEWHQYQEWGDESLDRIVDPAARRMIELRFMLAVLKIDPTAYPRNKNWFVRVLMMALVPVYFTHEHDYVSAVLNADRLKHPLLTDLPCVAEDTGRYAMSVRDLQELRLSMLRAVTRNVVGVMRRVPQTPKDKQMVADGFSGIVGSLAAMKDNCERTMPRNEAYIAFCREYVDHLRSSSLLWKDERIVNAASWINEVAAPLPV